jgi:hypothetical protein
MSIDVSDIFLDPFYARTLTQYGGDTVPLEALVWQRFVGIYNIDISQPLTDTQKSAFKAFLQRYQAWGLTVDDLTGVAVQPSSSKYQSCYVLAASLFPGVTNVEMKDIWNGFLKAFSLDSDQIASQDLSALFTNYLKTLYDKLSAYESLPSSQQELVTDPEQVYQIALWNRFLEVYGYSPRDTSTKELEGQFSAFVQQYTNWHMDLATLQSTNTLPNGDGADFFLTYLNSFYGQLSIPERTDLWNRFLGTKGLTTNPVDLSSLRESFVNFINGLQSQKAAYEAATALSPQEIAQRTIFSDLMTSLQKMLVASEGVVINSAAALKIYSAWQKEYTKQMTQAPSLVAVPTTDLNTSRYTTLRIPSDADPSKWDLADYTFGYGNISLEDVIRWGYATLTKDPSTPLTYGDAKSPMGAYSFKMTTDSQGRPAIEVKFDLYLKDPTYKNDVTYPRPDYGVDLRPDLYTEVTQTATFAIKDSSGTPLINPDTGDFYTFDDSVSELEGKFKEIFSALATQTPYSSDTSYTVITNLRGDPTATTNPYYPSAIEGRYLGDVETWIDDTGNMMVDTNELQKRSEQNVVIQQYVNTTRAKREMVQNATQQIQTVLQKARDSINQISSLWTSVLEAISTIMNSIYKR